MNILENTEKTLILSTSLPQNSFAKTDMSSLLSKKSIILHIDKSPSVSAEDYFFTSTKTNDKGDAVFEGNAFKGELLSQILEKPSYSKKDIISIVNYTKAIDFLIKNSSKSEEESHFATGAAGLIINTDEACESSDILIIEGGIFEECAENLQAHYTDLQGRYLYKGLDYLQSLCFIRATVAYRALSGHFPFENEDTTERQEDILDGAFIPLSLWKQDINPEFEQSINSSLKARITSQIVAGKKTLTDTKAEKKKQKLLSQAVSFSPELFQKELEEAVRIKASSGSEDCSLSQKRGAYYEKMEKRLRNRRFLRRNKVKLFALASVIVLIVWGSESIIKQNGKLLTTRGLDSASVAQAYYSTINNLDVPDLSETVMGKKTKDLIARISAYYVSSKQRQQIHPDMGTVPMAKWFFYRNPKNNLIFGITKLRIDGREYTVDFNFPKRNQRPEPLKEEKGRTLKEGDETRTLAEYYLIEQNDDKIYVQKNKDTLTLLYSKKRWRVTGCDTETEVTEIDQKDFVKDYYEALGIEEEADNDILTRISRAQGNEKERDIKSAVNQMRQKYIWLPGEEDMQNAARFMWEEYGIKEAESYLK